jgi:hypothetical protein
MKNTEKQRQYLLKILNHIPQSEQQLQSKCAELLYFFYPDHWKRLVCVHNNSFRANTQGFGIVPGASDMYWIGESGCVKFIEFKFSIKSAVSKDQYEWAAILNGLGHVYYFCYCELDFWQIIGFNQPGEADIEKILERFE